MQDQLSGSLLELAIQYSTKITGIIRKCAILMLGVLSAGTGVAALPSITISDGPDGVSCEYLLMAGMMAWERRGGDWIDSVGTKFGQSFFSTTQVPRTRTGDLVKVDMTALVQAWQKGAGPAGGVFLASDSGRIRFHSRESEDISLRPTLKIIWHDGQVTETSASADSMLNCSGKKGFGRNKIIRLSQDTNSVLLFPFNPEQTKLVKVAQLELVVERSSPPTTVAVFRPLLPSTQDSTQKPGLARAYPGDKGIEKHSAVVFAERFETEGWRSQLLPSNKSNVRLTDARANHDFSPIDGRALNVTIPAGGNQALNAHFRFLKELGKEPDEMYFRYALRLGENWDPSLSGGKLPGFSGTYGKAGWGGRKSNGINGWATRGAFLQHRVQDSMFGDLRGIGSYVYHADMKGTYGETWGWNLGSGGLLEKSRWYSVEQYVRMNTPGQNDGVFKTWIDGVVTFERTNLRFRDIADLKIESLWLNVWYGGVDPAPKEMTLYIDNLVISREYIGPIQGR